MPGFGVFFDSGQLNKILILLSLKRKCLDASSENDGGLKGNPNVRRSKTAQIKDGIIERDHIMNDRKTRSRNPYLPLHMIQEYKDMQCH